MSKNKIELADTGARVQYKTGSQKELFEGKGRMDLLPFAQIASVFDWMSDDRAANLSPILYALDRFISTGDRNIIVQALRDFITAIAADPFTPFLEVSKIYEAGANKYAARDWEKGRPLSVFIDSAARHLFKYYRGDTDEPHELAVIWNMLGLIYTYDTFNNRNNPHYDLIIDLPWKINQKD